MTDPTPDTPQDTLEKAQCFDWLVAHPEVFKPNQFVGANMMPVILDLIRMEGAT